MRVADRTVNRQYLSNLNSVKSDFQKTSQQISSGNRFTAVSEDVSAATRVLRLRLSMHKEEVQHETVGYVYDELSAAEDNMSDINDILAEVYEIAIKAQNGTYDDDDLAIMGTEVKNLKEQVLNILNTKYNERFTFGGSNSSSQEPYSFDDDGDVCYNGYKVDNISKNDDGDYIYTDPDTFTETLIPMENDVYFDVGMGITMQGSQVDTTTAFKVSFSGLDFIGVGNDNILTLLQNMEDALNSGDVDSVGTIESRLTIRTKEFRANITEMGSKCNFLDNRLSTLERSIDTAKIRIDDLMGTDYEDAIIELSMNEAVLTALQNMASRILPNSLMNFI